MMLDTPAANVLGVTQQLVEHPDESRDYPFLTDAPDGGSAVNNLPRDWDSARSSLQNAADAINAARNDFQSWKDGADFDDSLRSKFRQNSSDVVDSLCNALHEARTYYAAAGGYPNDLSFVLLNDKGDRPCQNVGMGHPYTTIIKRRALATIAESTNELPESNVEEAFLSDHVASSFLLALRSKSSDTDILTAPKARYVKCTAAVAPAGSRVRGLRAHRARPTDDLTSRTV